MRMAIQINDIMGRIAQLYDNTQMLHHSFQTEDKKHLYAALLPEHSVSVFPLMLWARVR